MLFAPVLVLSANAMAATVFNTGVDDTGALLAAGTQDDNFPLMSISSCCGAGVNTYVESAAQIAAGAYSGASALVADTPTAQWIGGGLHSGAIFGFAETFTLTEADIDAGGLEITGEVGLTDLYNNISLNGHSDLSDAFSEDYGAALHNFTIDSGFQVGTNTLVFSEVWTDTDQTTHGNNTPGLIVDDLVLSGGAAPEPGTFALLGGCLAAAAATRRFRK